MVLLFFCSKLTIYGNLKNNFTKQTYKKYLKFDEK